jgi:hypothetical protein
MKIIGRSLEKLDGRLGTFSIEVFANLLKPQWISGALEATGRSSERIRKLPAPFVVWLVIAMGLFRSLSIKNVLSRLGEIPGHGSLWKRKKPESTSVADARNRVGFSPLRMLMYRLREWILERYRNAMTWQGRVVCALDGSTFMTPDSPQNVRRFGLPGSNRGRAAFPQMRALFLVSAHLHFVLDAVFGPYRRSELALFFRVLPSIPIGAILLMDRNFDAWIAWTSVVGEGSDVIVRAKRRRRGRLVQILGRGDHLIDVFTPKRELRDNPDLPKSFLMREISVRIRGRNYLFLTSLLDVDLYPAKELIQLYAQRWEEEITLDEIKTHQCGATTVNRPVIFRSKTTRRVLQEAFGLVIAYNLVRCHLADAAAQAQVPAVRISFVDCLERIRDACLLMAAAPTGQLPDIYRDLLISMAQCRLSPRRDRRNPRAVCVKMSAYPLKKKSA